VTSRDLVNRLLSLTGSRLEKCIGDRVSGLHLHEDIDIILGRKSGYEIFDLGGNEGQSIRHFQQDFRTPRIISFEPARSCLEILKRKFGNQPSVQIVPKAVGENTSTGELKIFERSGMNSLLPLEPGAAAVGARLDVLETEKVEIISLDDFTAQNGIEKIDILKIDCQGGEMAILRGAKRLLAEQLVKCLYLEVMFKPLYRDQAALSEYVRFLEPFNFDLTGFYKPALRQTALFHCDVLFTRREGATPDTAALI
jgi:FkbM family methyltransferase